MQCINQPSRARANRRGDLHATDLHTGTRRRSRRCTMKIPRTVYEDGDSESRVPARLIRPLATAPPRDLIPTPLTTTSQAPPPTDVETGGEL